MFDKVPKPVMCSFRNRNRSNTDTAPPAYSMRLSLRAILVAALLGCLLPASAAFALPAALLETKPAASADVVKPGPDAAATHARDRGLQALLRARYEGIAALQQVTPAVQAGVVRLDGEVDNDAQRKLAVLIAKQATGTDSVNDQLRLTTDLGVRLGTGFEQVVTKLVRVLSAGPLLLVAIAIVFLMTWLGRFLSRRLHWMRLRSHNPYMDGLLRGLVRAVFVLAGLLIALDLLGATALVGAVLGSAGVVGLVLGFAFKDIAENYIAGILLSLRRPFAPGDHIVVEKNEGKVVALTSRVTILITLDGNHLQLPNALVFKSVLLNYSRNPKRRFEFTTEIGTHPSWSDALELGIVSLAGVEGVLADPAPSAQIQELSVDGATLRFMAWIDQRANDLLKTRSEAMRLVRRGLREAGITSPSPTQRVELIRDSTPGKSPDASDSAEQRDVSVDHDVDNQVDAARGAHGMQGDKDLLAPKAGDAPAPQGQTPS